LGFAAAPHDFALFQSDDLVTADSKFRKYLVGLFVEPGGPPRHFARRFSTTRSTLA
jgi:hypothetical protein